MQKIPIYLLFIVAVSWDIIDFLPFRFVMSAGGSQLRETDFLVFLLVIFWKLFAPKNENNANRDSSFTLFFFLTIILIIPIFIGIFNEKPISAVVRDFRTPLYYFAMIPMASFFRDQDNTNKFLRVIILMGCVGALIGISRWYVIGGIDEFGRARFGFGSMYSTVAWSMFLSIAFLMFRNKSLEHFCLVLFYILFCLVYIFLANDSRSLYVGTLAGLFFLFIIYRQIKKEKSLLKGSQSKSKALRVVFLFVITGLTVNVIFISFPDIIREISSHNNVVRVLYSLYSPEGGETEYANRTDRMNAISYAYDLAIENYGFGCGYGDNSFVRLDEKTIQNIVVARLKNEDLFRNAAEAILFFHNAYAWALARLGLWMSLLFFITILTLIFRALKVVYEKENQFDRVILSGSIAFAIFNLFSGFGGGGFFDFMGPGMIPWLFCLTFLSCPWRKYGG